MRTRAVRPSILLATAFGAAALVGSSVAAAAPHGATPSAASPVLDMRFDGGTAGSTIDGSTLTNSGTAAVVGSIVTRGTAGTGPLAKPRATYRAGVNAAGGTAARFPSWIAADQDPPLAVLGVSNATTPANAAADPLNPGTKPFTWQADFRLDTDSGETPADGDNLFQRGLSPTTLWKLQVDHGKAVCTIRAAAPSTGAVTEVSTTPISVTRNAWYRGICARTADSKLTIEIQKYGKGTWQTVGQSTSTKSVVGTLDMDPATPVAIAGKLRSATTIVTTGQSPSQFNGLVDNAVLTIG